MQPTNDGNERFWNLMRRSRSVEEFTPDQIRHIIVSTNAVVLPIAIRGQILCLSWIENATIGQHGAVTHQTACVSERRVAAGVYLGLGRRLVSSK